MAIGPDHHLIAAEEAQDMFPLSQDLFELELG
jgi:hypothetical protein